MPCTGTTCRSIDEVHIDPGEGEAIWLAQMGGRRVVVGRRPAEGGQRPPAGLGAPRWARNDARREGVRVVRGEGGDLRVGGDVVAVSEARETVAVGGRVERESWFRWRALRRFRTPKSRSKCTEFACKHAARAEHGHPTPNTEARGVPAAGGVEVAARGDAILRSVQRVEVARVADVAVVALLARERVVLVVA